MNLAVAYQTAKAAKSFTHFIAESQWQQLGIGLNSVKFFSILMDGSTDAGKIESELFLVMFDKDGVDEKVLTKMEYLKVSTHLQCLLQVSLIFCLKH